MEVVADVLADVVAAGSGEALAHSGFCMACPVDAMVVEAQPERAPRTTTRIRPRWAIRWLWVFLEGVMVRSVGAAC